MYILRFLALSRIKEGKKRLAPEKNKGTKNRPHTNGMA
jgi:hypothetical protein